ncbi:btb/poz domain-containing protein 19-like [Gigaspora margarita]|uniref:Btb/poz domain-containing protein 19-like n=1 Tax=Gigaspora margarita TaxID=4874 RepID=A0A8H4AFS5_GIGMA|nr:btb/poz domain-containing protein 19-like [Gigaspora margarita]
MSSNFLTGIAEDYRQLYETREDYDVIIYVGEESNAEEIHAHSLVLRTRSTYFRGALSSGWATKDKDSGCFIFNKPNISPLIFEFILKDTILELLVASDEFGLTKLIDHFQQNFGGNLEIHLSQNPVDIFYIIAQHEAFNEIRNLSLETISTKPEIVFESNNSYGPNFGSGDLHLNGNCVNASGNGYHPSVGITNGSQIEDYEVFQVIKK